MLYMVNNIIDYQIFSGFYRIDIDKDGKCVCVCAFMIPALISQPLRMVGVGLARFWSVHIADWLIVGSYSAVRSTIVTSNLYLNSLMIGFIFWLIVLGIGGLIFIVL